MRFDSVILIKIRRQAQIKCACRFCGCEPLQIPPAAVSRFKFAVPIVADMLNKRYRRRQFDSADSEFCDLEKPNIKEIHCFRAVDFFAAMCRFKFRLWNSWCVSCDSETAGLNALQIA